MSTPQDDELGQGWDRLRESEDDPPPAVPEAEDAPEREGPGAATMVAAALGDLVTILAVCTAALSALVLLGQHHLLPCFGWAMALALAWWLTAGTVLVLVRRASPGMLLAGVAFARPIEPRRVPAVLAAALILAATAGVLALLLGPARSPLRPAAGSALGPPGHSG